MTDNDIMRKLESSASFASYTDDILRQTGDVSQGMRDALRFTILLCRVLEPECPEMSDEAILDMVLDASESEWRLFGLAAVGAGLLSRSAYRMAEGDEEIQESTLEVATLDDAGEFVSADMAIDRVVRMGVASIRDDKVKWFFDDGEDG